MKPGDLVAWSEYAAQWSNAPEAGDYAGTVVRVIPRRRRGIAKVEIVSDEVFIVGRQMVKVISSVNSST
jgi:hypothetical protein